MSYCSLKALMDAFPDETSLAGHDTVKAVALFDHEEVGSSSAQGRQAQKELHPLRDDEPLLHSLTSRARTD